jgi:hypothetical protein
VFVEVQGMSFCIGDVCPSLGSRRTRSIVALGLD